MHEDAKNLESLLIEEPTKVIKLFQLVRNYCASSIFLQRVKGMHDKLKAQAALQVSCASNTDAAASAKANVAGLPNSLHAAPLLPPKRAGSGTRTTFIDNANAALKEKERVKAAADAAKTVAAAADAAKAAADAAKAVKAAAKAAAALKAKEAKLAKASSQASKRQRDTPSTCPPARKGNLRPPALGTIVLDDEVSHYSFLLYQILF